MAGVVDSPTPEKAARRIVELYIQKSEEKGLPINLADTVLVNENGSLQDAFRQGFIFKTMEIMGCE